MKRPELEYIRNAISEGVAPFKTGEISFSSKVHILTGALLELEIRCENYPGHVYHYTWFETIFYAWSPEALVETIAFRARMFFRKIPSPPLTDNIVLGEN